MERRRRRGSGGLAWARLATFAVLAVALGAEAALAQSNDDRTRVWLALGLAVGGSQGLETDSGLALQLTAQRGPHQFALRSLFLGDFDSFPSGSDDSVGEFGLTYGRSANTWFGYASVSSGVSLVSVTGLPDDGGGSASIYDDPSRRTLGVPFVAEAGLQSTLIGVGVQIFANLNTLSSFAGVGLALHLGWMP